MDLLHKGWFTEFSPDDYEAVKNGNLLLFIIIRFLF